MIHRGINRLRREKSSSKKGIQKRLVQPKTVKQIICKVCKKQASIKVCLKKHKKNIHNLSPKTSECSSCGKKFIVPRRRIPFRTNNFNQKCVSCRKRHVNKEKKIMISKIVRLIHKTENLSRKCALAEMRDMVEYLSSVKARLVMLKTHLNMLKV